jgi:flagellum-specific ATP synthase
MPAVIDLRRYHDALTNLNLLRCQGRVTQVIGLTIEAEGMASQVGELCYIYPAGTDVPMAAEVVGFRSDRTLLMPLG